MLKKFLISAVFGAAAIGAIPAMAEDGPNWTKDEQTTIDAYNKFNECYQKGMDATAAEAGPVVLKIVKARDKATAEVAKAEGLTDDQVDLISKALGEPEQRVLMSIIMQAEDMPQKLTCAKDAKILDASGERFSQEFVDKINPILQKREQYMQEQMEKQQPKKPALTP